MKFHQDYVKIKRRSQIQANIQISSSPDRRETTEAPPGLFMADGSTEKKNRMWLGGRPGLEQKKSIKMYLQI